MRRTLAHRSNTPGLGRRRTNDVPLTQGNVFDSRSMEVNPQDLTHSLAQHPLDAARSSRPTLSPTR